MLYFDLKLLKDQQESSKPMARMLFNEMTRKKSGTCTTSISTLSFPSQPSRNRDSIKWPIGSKSQPSTEWRFSSQYVWMTGNQKRNCILKHCHQIMFRDLRDRIDEAIAEAFQHKTLTQVMGTVERGQIIAGNSFVKVYIQIFLHWISPYQTTESSFSWSWFRHLPPCSCHQNGETQRQKFGVDSVLRLRQYWDRRSKLFLSTSSKWNHRTWSIELNSDTRY